MFSARIIYYHNSYYHFIITIIFYDLNYLTISFKKGNRSLGPDSKVAEKGKKRGETEKMISGPSEPSSELPLSSLRSPIFFFFLNAEAGVISVQQKMNKNIKKYIAEK